MRRIPLTQGKFALIDDEDFERVNQFKWRAYCGKDKQETWYAARTVRIPTKPKARYFVVLMHRFILPHDMPHTDHRDRNGLNNQKENLRPCTRRQNGGNRNVQENKSGFKGVGFKKDNPNKPWSARVTLKGKRVTIGYFITPQLAAQAYDAAAIRHYGEFARTNQQMGLL